MSVHANYSTWSWFCLWNSNSIALAISLFLFITVIVSITKKKKLDKQPPGPRGLPILGYLPFLGTDLHRDFTKLSQTYGPIYKLWLGKKLCIVISSPTIAKQVVREQDVVFANRDATVASLTMSYGGYDIAFADYGEYWKKMRKIFVREMMSNKSIEGCSNLRREEVRKLIRSVYSNSNSKVVGSDEGVDIGVLALRVVVNATMAMVWGSTTEEERVSEFQQAFTEVMVVLGLPNVSDFFPFIARFDVQGIRKRTEKALECFHSFIETIISERAAKERVRTTVGEEEEEEEEEEDKGDNSRQKKDILQILLDLQLTGHNFGSKELKAVLSDIIVGGADTTATTIEWVMTRLLYHPDVMEKVVDELTRVVGVDNTVEEFHLSELNYLDAVIKESLRLNPALPLLIPKASRHNTTLCGYNIPKGTKLFVNMWAIQRDPQLWDNPEEFRPDRFFDNPTTFDFYGNNFQFMPFGSGRRICPGIPLAEKMAKYVLASLLHSFHWELPQGVELEFEDRFGIVLKKLNRLVAIPTPRLSNPNIYM